MSWVKDQINERKKNDDRVLGRTWSNIYSSVLSNNYINYQDSENAAERALGDILNFYGIKEDIYIDEDTLTLEDVKRIMDPHGIMYREVDLDGKWYKQAVSPLLAFSDDGRIMAFIPGEFSGYYYFDIASGKKVKINKKNIDDYFSRGICFYKPLPDESLSIKDLVKYIVASASKGDFFLTAALLLSVTLIELITPAMTLYLFSSVVSAAALKALLATGIFLICVVISSTMITGVRTIVNNKIAIKQKNALEAAVMMRVLAMPPSFFREFSSGELAKKMAYINSMCDIILNGIFEGFITFLFSCAYLVQIGVLAPALVGPAIVTALATVALDLVFILMDMRIQKKEMEYSAKQYGLSYAAISGVQKIKLAGAEKRMLARWGMEFSRELKVRYGKPLFLRISSVLTLIVSLAGTVWFYYVAAQNGISSAQYYAFISAFGLVSGAFECLSELASSLALLKPIMDIAEPLLKTVPEVKAERSIVTDLRGRIELDHVFFRYSEDMPWVLNDLSLTIKAGQYIGIVGSSGCGKSTLMRLILGFEKAEKGSVSFDGRNLEDLDSRSLRSHMGVVIQNGKLLHDDIYSNITVSNPGMSLEDAWKAAEIAGIADDIRQMPMGMYTYLNEGSGGISGGQKQRIMIARAVAGNPKILLFDEATSALDNATQKKISDAIDKLNCTRIVIAHRLSTIKNCDRIIVLDEGRIAEDGNYEELSHAGGKFSELIARQKLENSEL